MVVDLTKMKAGQSGIVIELQAGRGFALRLQNLGITVGSRITKMSGHFWRGPVTVQVKGASVALGFGMARHVLVEVTDNR